MTLVMPLGRSQRIAPWFVRWRGKPTTTACLDEVYAGVFVNATLPRIDAALTIHPLVLSPLAFGGRGSCSSICLIACLQQRKTPRPLMDQVLSKLRNCQLSNVLPTFRVYYETLTFPLPSRGTDSFLRSQCLHSCT